jgi:hypothetical protein
VLRFRFPTFSQPRQVTQAVAHGTTVLGQLLALVPSGLFDKLATQYTVNKCVRKMTASAHFAVMLFIQLAGLPSLRKAKQPHPP